MLAAQRALWAVGLVVRIDRTPADVGEEQDGSLFEGIFGVGFGAWHGKSSWDEVLLLYRCTRLRVTS